MVWLRDDDGDSDRNDDLHKGIEQASEYYPSLRIVGGVPSPSIEAWIFAARTGRHPPSNLEKALHQEGIRWKNSEAYSTVLREAKDQYPPLAEFLADLRRALA